MESNRRLRAIWKIAFCVAAAVGSIAAAPADADKLYVLRTGDLSGLRKLLEHGVSANATDSCQITPLMYAAEVASAKAMSILVDHGAEVNAQNALGSTALMRYGR